MSDGEYQQRFWNFLVETRVQLSYLHHYAAASQWWDKAIDIFLAITSSTSIAAWALWKEFTFLWPTLIAASQVITAVKPFLPYKQRLKVLGAICNDFQNISLELEKDWFAVAEGQLTEQQIHDLTIKHRGQTVAAEQKHLRDVVLPRRSGIMKKAENDAVLYFRRHYKTELA